VRPGRVPINTAPEIDERARHDVDALAHRQQALDLLRAEHDE